MAIGQATLETKLREDKIKQKSKPGINTITKIKWPDNKGYKCPRSVSSWYNEIRIFWATILLIFTFPISAWFAMKRIQKHERIVVHRLGKILKIKKPGLALVLPFIDEWQRVDLRTKTLKVPVFKVTTAAGEGILIKAVLRYQICKPIKSVTAVKNVATALKMKVREWVSRTFKKKGLNELDMEKPSLEEQMLAYFQKRTKAWGVQVYRVQLIYKVFPELPTDTPPRSQDGSPVVPGLEGPVDPVQKLDEHSNNGPAVASHDLDETEEPYDRNEYPSSSTPRCYEIQTVLAIIILVLTFPISAWFALKRVREHERIVVQRLGKILDIKKPGLALVLPFIDEWQRVDLRTKTLKIPLFKVTTEDGERILIDVSIGYQIRNPVKSVMAVKNVDNALEIKVQKWVTQIFSNRLLHEVYIERESTEEEMLVYLQKRTKFWGVQVYGVEMIYKVLLEVENDRPQRAVSGLEGPVDSDQKLDEHSIDHHLSENNYDLDEIEEPYDGSIVTFEDELERQPDEPTPLKAILSAEDMITAAEDILSEELVKTIQACYHFKIIRPGGQMRSYFLDLKTGRGKAGRGEPDSKPDVVLEMSEANLKRMIRGDLRPLTAYMTGKVRLRGDLITTTKLEDIFTRLMQ